MSTEVQDAGTQAVIERQQERIERQKRRDSFREPRAGTFENYGAAMAHEHDTAAVWWVSSPADKAMEALERIAADDRLNPQAQQGDFIEVKKGALEEIEQRYDDTLAEIDSKIAALEPKAKRAFSSSLDAGKLNYTRSTLEGQVASKQLNEYTLEKLWEKALDDCDAVTVQVLMDNGATLIRQARPATQRDAELSKRTKALLDRSDDFLRSPEQKKARAELLKLEATRWQANKAYTLATGKLKNATISQKKLVDQRVQNLRSRF